MGEPPSRALRPEPGNDPAQGDGMPAGALGAHWHPLGRVDQLRGSRGTLVTKLLGSRVVVEWRRGALRARLASPTERTVAVEEWNGFLMVNLDPGAEPLGPQLAPLTDHFAPYRLHEWVNRFLVEVDADWNWEQSERHFSVPDRTDGSTTANRPAWALQLSEETGASRRDSLLPRVPALPSPLSNSVSSAQVGPALKLTADASKVLWLQIAAHEPGRHFLRWSLLLPRATAQSPPLAEPLEDYCELLRVALEDQFEGLHQRVMGSP